MIRLLPRALALSLAGAIAGVLLLVLAFTRHSTITLEMDRDLPRNVSGLYPVERAGEDTFAWSSGRAVLALAGLDRRVPWQCTVRLRSGRPGDPPTVRLVADGQVLVEKVAPAVYTDVDAIVPTRDEPGLALALETSTTFVPSASDTRALGVQVDRLRCRPDGTLALPPRRTLGSAAVTGAVIGAGAALLMTSAATALLAALVGAVILAEPLSNGLAPYSALADITPYLAVWTLGVAVVLAGVLGAWRRETLTAHARVAIACAAGALFALLLGLLHPAKAIVDAVFHAHRLEWVLAGRYYFTQPMPDGVAFPYAIGLYVFAAPWSALTRDHVLLLRIVVCAAHAFAVLLFYTTVVRTWTDRTIGATAVALFFAAPLPYVVIGNANLTYAFGQAAAYAALVVALAWPWAHRRVSHAAVLAAVTALAFLSHVGILSILGATLVALAALLATLGGPRQRGRALVVLAAAVIAAVFSVVVYYGHFGDAYRSLARVRAPAAVDAPAVPGAGPSSPAAPGLPARVGRALELGLRAAGWPLVVLALVGAWRVRAEGGRDPLALAIAALALVYAVFVVFSVAAPVEARFQRYNDEFIERVSFATLPAVVLLAARAEVWLVRQGAAGRVAAHLLALAAAVLGSRQWLAWMR